MHRLLLASAALAAVAAVAAAPAARATIITFTTTSYGNTGTTVPPSGLPLSITMNVAAPPNGSFNLSLAQGGGGPTGPGTTAPPPTYTGDVGGFTSFTGDVSPGGVEVYTRAAAPGPLSISLTFDAIGAVLTSSIYFSGNGASANISGTNGTASGFVSSDAGGCSLSGSNRTCYVSGYFTPGATAVPEPATIASFGAALLGLAAQRRRVQRR